MMPYAERNVQYLKTNYYYFSLLLNKWKWHFLLLIIFVTGGSKARTPSTDITGLRVPTMNFEHFLSLYVNQSLIKLSLRQFATAANSACSGFDISRTQIIKLSHI